MYKRLSWPQIVYMPAVTNSSINPAVFVTYWRISSVHCGNCYIEFKHQTAQRDIPTVVSWQRKLFNSCVRMMISASPNCLLTSVNHLTSDVLWRRRLDVHVISLTAITTTSHIDRPRVMLSVLLHGTVCRQAAIANHWTATTGILHSTVREYVFTFFF